jgi:hypothetical protein
MPRLPSNPDRDFSASPSDNEVEAEIAKLFASQPPGMGEFFEDPIVRLRIGMLITRALNRPMRPRRRPKSR